MPVHRPDVHPAAHFPRGYAPVVVVGSYKSVALAIVLGFFLGPLGMLYSTLAGAAVMFVVNLVAVPLTFGLGLVITIPISATWAGMAASHHNSRLAAMGAPRV